jgi:tRNA A37 threonylcarbamoyladenosine synthetase subunit TsaC/SUA5/YrdC
MMNMQMMTDNPIGHDVAAEAAQVLNVLDDGGVAIIPLNVAYAILGRAEGAIRRIFEVKQRSFEKPSGMFGGAAASRDLHVLDDQGQAIRRALIEDADLPFSIVANYRKDHPLLAGVDPFVLQTSTKGETMDMLINAGPLHNALAALSHERKTPVFGSSANQSLSGSKYRVCDIEPAVLKAADIVIDHGTCRDANDEGLSSTIIDFKNYSVVRAGCRFNEIQKFVDGRFGISLQAG